MSLLNGTPMPFVCSKCGGELSTADYRSWTGARLCLTCKQAELNELSSASQVNQIINEKED